MKIIVGVVGTTILLMGIYLLVLSFITLRLYHLSLTGIVKVSEGYSEINTYAMLGIAAMLIGVMIIIRNRDW